MHVTVRPLQTSRLGNYEAGPFKEGAILFSILIASALFFGFLFNRETALSYSIGYNLYGAQRVLAGEVPYRDFHTLYPPATVYLNAAIFGVFGISLYNALLGVFVFKVITTAALYASGLMIMPRAWATVAACSSLLWLRPNGPFKAVPMHYGAFFLALALFLVLKYVKGGGKSYLLFAGVSLGALALFKHNIGAYALAGTLLAVLPSSRKGAMVLAGGFLLPVLPVVFFIASQDALREMSRTLIFGPGDFLLSRLAGWPSPAGFLVFAVLLACAGLLIYRRRSSARIVSSGSIILVLACCSFVIFSRQSVIDSLVFCAPVAVILWGAVRTFAEFKRGMSEWRVSLIVLVTAASAFLEAFPRFAREQAVASMPFVTLLLLYLIYRSAPLPLGRIARTALVSLLPLTLFLVGARLFLNTYFDGRLGFKSDTELNAERGRGVYFPKDRAEEIDGVVSYIRQHVEEGGYFFAHAYAGSSYLFLADRNNPSGAQFWGGVGVTDSERVDTLRAIDEKRIDLVITTDRDLRAEAYKPMREYIEKIFRADRRFGEVIMLRRTGVQQ